MKRNRLPLSFLFQSAGRRAIGGFLGLLLLSATAPAETKVWVGGGANNGWGQAPNWSPSGWADGSDVVFDGNSTNWFTSNLGAARIANSVTVNGPPSNLLVTNNTLTVSNGITVTSGSLVIYSHVTVPTAQSWSVAPGQTLRLGYDTDANNRALYLYDDFTWTGTMEYNRIIDVNSNTTLTIGPDTVLKVAASPGPDAVFRLGTSGGPASPTVNQTGGSVTLGRNTANNAILNLGQADLLGGTATYNLSGGLLDADDESRYIINVGNSVGGDSVINVDGTGQFYASDLRLGLTGPGTLNMSGGLVRASVQLALPQGVSNGTVNLAGGALEVAAIRKSGAGAGTLNLDGGTLRPIASTNAFIPVNVAVNVQNGGAVVDTAGYDVTIAAPLAAAGSGGLLKLGDGTLTLAGTNTYTGATVAGGGRLVLSTADAGGGAITVSNGAALGVVVAAPGDTLETAALVLDAGATTNDLLVGTTGSPTAPVILATNLVAGGTTAVNLSGVGFSLGQFPIIRYLSASGLSDSSFVTGSVPTGVSASLSNNTVNGTIDLVITAVPNLVWRAQTDNLWDLATVNWVDDLGGAPATFFDGAVAIFNDVASNTTVAVTAVVSPARTIVDNSVSNYVFGDAGYIAGGGGLIKTGSGQLDMGLSGNSYAGDTRISNGVFRLTVSNAIPDGAGKGNVLVEGTLDLDGFDETLNGLSGSGLITNSAGFVDTTNTLTIGNNNASSVFSGGFADNPAVAARLAVTKVGTGTIALDGASRHGGNTLADAGRLEIGHDQAFGLGLAEMNLGTIATRGGARSITNDWFIRGGTGRNIIDTGAGDLTLWGAMTGLGNNNNREFTKDGENALRFGNTASLWLSTSEGFDIRGGTVVLDGARATNSNDGLRMMASNDAAARLTIENGGSWLLQGGANFRGGNAARTMANTNVVDLSSGELVFGGTVNEMYLGDAAGTLCVFNQSGGEVRWDNPANANGVRLASSAGSEGVYNLDGGTLRVSRVYQVDSTGAGRFRFNGGTLIASGGGNASTFLQGLAEATVGNGDAVIDTAGYNLVIAQPLLAAGTGGLAKNGLGELALTGSNTYSGATAVNQGALRVTTAQTGGGAVTVADEAAFGVTVHATGATFNASALAMGAGGWTTLNLDAGALGNPTDAVVRAAAFSVNGAATVNVSGSYLAAGQFKLVDYDGAIGGFGFSSLLLGPLPPGVQGFLVDNAVDKSVDLLVTNIAAYVWTGATDTNWDVNATANWSYLGSPVAYADGAPARFDDTSASTNVYLAANVQPNGVVVSNETLDYLFEGPGRVAGAGALVKEGAGTLRLNLTNAAFDGVVTVSGGTLVAENANALGTAAGGTVIQSGGTLDVNALVLNTEPFTVSGAGVGGNGAIVNNGAAGQNNATRYVTLAGDTTFGGAQRWDVRGTTTVLGSLGTGGQPWNIVKTGANFVGIVNAQVDPALADIDVQSGGLGYETATPSLGDPARTLTIGAGAYLQMWNCWYPLDKKIVLQDGGSLRSTSGTSNSVAGTVSLPSGMGVVQVNGGVTLVLSNTVSGAGGLAKIQNGTLTLAASNTFSGPVEIQAGVLEVETDANLGSAPALPTPGHLTITGGTLQATAGFTLNANRGLAVGPTSGTGTGTLNVVTGTVDYAGTIADTAGGTGLLTKAGSGILRLTGTNTFSGGLRLNAGVLEAGNDTVAGTGQLTLNGGTLSSDGTAARSFTNDVLVTSQSGLGDATNNGLITLIGGIDFNGAGRGLVVASEAVLSGATTNGRPNKRGPATLTLTGDGVWNGDSDVFDGTLVVDGATITNGGAFRPNSDQPGGVARLVWTNGASVVITNTNPNLRAGYQAGDGTQTNILDVAGTVRMPNADAGNGRAILGSSCALGLMNLWPGGDLEIRYVRMGDHAPNGDGVFNFRGGVVRPKGDEANFIRTITAANVMEGGAIFDTQGYTVTVIQPLLSGDGDGGLEKRGAGTLALAGACTYTGVTLVADGTLLVNGSISTGAVVVATNAVLGGSGTVGGEVAANGHVSPGASVGLLTVGGFAPSASGVFDVELGGANPGTEHDQLVVSGTAALGGTLSVTLTNGFTPVVGQSFTVLTAAAVSGAFATNNVPAVSGIGWSVTNTGTEVVLTAEAGGSPYDSWTSLYGLAPGGGAGDADGDGTPDLFEYSQLSNPTNAASKGLLGGAQTGGVLRLDFVRNTNAVDITYIVEAAFAVSNGAPWLNINSNYHGAGWSDPARVTETGSGEARAVTVYDTETASTNRFMRLRITKP